MSTATELRTRAWQYKTVEKYWHALLMGNFMDGCQVKTREKIRQRTVKTMADPAEKEVILETMRLAASEGKK